jgi:hypothetical protein
VNRYFTVAAGTVGACLALLLAAPAAHADAVDDAVTGLRSAPVYVAPGVSEPKIDVSAVTQAIGSRPIKIAVLPDGDYGSTSKAFDAAQRIGRALAPSSPMTVGVVAGPHFNAASSQYCSGVASTVASDSVEANKDQLQQTNDVTSTIESFVTGLQSRPQSGSAACKGSSAAGASDATEGSGGSGAVPGCSAGSASSGPAASAPGCSAAAGGGRRPWRAAGPRCSRSTTGSVPTCRT